jgi:SAM-dependent methyltransferase
VEQSHQAPVSARESYEHTAAVYDAFTAHHDYERWLPRLVLLARSHGLRGRRLLDVGCGTGKSFLPLLRSGWQVTGCDISPSMLRRARSKAAGRVRLEVADMRDLPVLGSFDLAWVIDDAINYMLTPRELEQCLRGLARNLAPGGRVLFDTNTLATYRTFYAETEVLERGKWQLTWNGHATAATAPSSEVAATLEVRTRDAARQEPLARAVHRQRHFAANEIEAAIDSAGLQCLGTFGQGYEGYAEQPLDESRHTKAIFVGKRKEGR